MLSGSFPIVLTNLSKLNYLSLYYNRFTGYLPFEITFLTSLTGLNLYTNHFIGSILYLSSLTNLQELLIHRNKFSGILTSEF